MRGWVSCSRRFLPTPIRAEHLAGPSAEENLPTGCGHRTPDAKACEDSPETVSAPAAHKQL